MIPSTTPVITSHLQTSFDITLKIASFMTTNTNTDLINSILYDKTVPIESSKISFQRISKFTGCKNILVYYDSKTAYFKTNRKIIIELPKMMVQAITKFKGGQIINLSFHNLPFTYAFKDIKKAFEFVDSSEAVVIGKLMTKLKRFELSDTFAVVPSLNKKDAYAHTLKVQFPLELNEEDGCTIIDEDGKLATSAIIKARSCVKAIIELTDVSIDNSNSKGYLNWTLVQLQKCSAKSELQGIFERVNFFDKVEMAGHGQSKPVTHATNLQSNIPKPPSLMSIPNTPTSLMPISNTSVQTEPSSDYRRAITESVLTDQLSKLKKVNLPHSSSTPIVTPQPINEILDTTKQLKQEKQFTVPNENRIYDANTTTSKSRSRLRSKQATRATITTN